MWEHVVRDWPDRSTKAVEDENWGQSDNPNYVTLMVTDSSFDGYGKAIWLGVNNVNEREIEPFHVAEVPKPEANWGRVKE